MQRSLELAVREHLLGFLAGHTGPDYFKDWLVQVTWDSDEATDPVGRRFANEIKLRFAEHSGGFLSDDELRDALLQLAGPSVTTVTVADARGPLVPRTGSTARTVVYGRPGTPPHARESTAATTAHGKVIQWAPAPLPVDALLGRAHV